jgi:hypothetical protein
MYQPGYFESAFPTSCLPETSRNRYNGCVRSNLVQQSSATATVTMTCAASYRPQLIQRSLIPVTLRPFPNCSKVSTLVAHCPSMPDRIQCQIGIAHQRLSKPIDTMETVFRVTLRVVCMRGWIVKSLCQGVLYHLLFHLLVNRRDVKKNITGRLTKQCRL